MLRVFRLFARQSTEKARLGREKEASLKYESEVHIRLQQEKQQIEIQFQQQQSVVLNSELAQLEQQQVLYRKQINIRKNFM